jgi:curli biogenesis system outer membrane secretion channel CsgG
MKISYLGTLVVAMMAIGGAALVCAQDGGAKADQKSDAKNDTPKVKLDLPPYTGPKKRLGVMDLEVKVTATQTTNPTPQGGIVTTTTTTNNTPPPAVTAGGSSDFGTGLTEMLTTALVDSGRFVVLERKAMADIQAEQALGAGPAADPTAATKTGKVLGAQTLIRGAVTEFSYSSSSTGTNGIFGNVLGISHSTNEAKVVLDIRIYDASTTQILASVKGVGSVKSSATGVNASYSNINLGSSSFQNSPLGDATRKAIADCVKQICQHMEKLPWEARIADLEADGSALYLNAGSNMGVKAGDEFDIFHPGRDIVDPDTKTIIGRTKDTKVGHAKVDSVTPGIAILKIVDGTGFAINDVVRFSSP